MSEIVHFRALKHHYRKFLLTKLSLILAIAPQLNAEEKLPGCIPYHVSHENCGFHLRKDAAKNAICTWPPSNEHWLMFINDVFKAIKKDKDIIVFEAEINNAYAVFNKLDGKRYRYILLDPDFPLDYSFVLAHEIGHHICNHLCSPVDRDGYWHQELEADRFAGYAFRRIWNSDPPREALDLLLERIATELPKEGSPTHPPLTQRLQAVVAGWDHGWSCGEASPVISPVRPDVMPSSASFSRLLTNSDIVGGDIAHLDNLDQNACLSACAIDARCVAYTYDKWNRWCFLKKSVGLLRFDPKYISGVRDGANAPSRSSAPIIMERFRGKAFPYGGQSTRSAKSLDVCEGRCKASASCVAVTYFESSRQCRLMDNVGEYFDEARTHSSVKRQAASP